MVVRQQRTLFVVALYGDVYSAPAGQPFKTKLLLFVRLPRRGNASIFIIISTDSLRRWRRKPLQ